LVFDARHIGIARLHLRLSAEDNDEGRILASVDYTVRVVRKCRAVDTLFNWAVLGQALFNAVAVGCGADWRRVKRHLADGGAADFIVPLVIQLLLLPAVSA